MDNLGEPNAIIKVFEWGRKMQKSQNQKDGIMRKIGLVIAGFEDGRES